MRAVERFMIGNRIAVSPRCAPPLGQRGGGSACGKSSHFFLYPSRLLQLCELSP
jgi:hypothetical protein